MIANYFLRKKQQNVKIGTSSLLANPILNEEGGLAFSFLQQKLYLKNVTYTSRNMSIHLFDGYIILRWWKWGKPDTSSDPLQTAPPQPPTSERPAGRPCRR
jgi:hypothetical protein